jgi:ribonuclease HI
MNCVGYGLCIRGEEGNFIKAKTLWSNLVCSSDVGEVMGLYHAIKWVRELQLSNVDFDMDAEKVLDYFNKGRNDIS